MTTPPHNPYAAPGDREGGWQPPPPGYTPPEQPGQKGQCGVFGLGYLLGTVVGILVLLGAFFEPEIARIAAILLLAGAIGFMFPENTRRLAGGFLLGAFTAVPLILIIGAGACVALLVSGG